MIFSSHTNLSKKYRKPFNELTGWERLELQGNVKQIMQISYSAHLESGQIVRGKIDIEREDGEPNFVVTYNVNGIAVCEESFTSYGSRKDTYTDDGTHILSEAFGLDGEQKEKSEYLYDGHRFLGMVKWDGDGKQTWRYEHRYNQHGRKSEELTFRNDPEELYRRKIYTYDEKGNMLTSTEFDGNGKLLLHSENKFDRKGLLIYNRTEWTDERMAKHNKIQERKYNGYGDCVQVDEFDLEGNLKETHHYQHEYDENGKRINPNIVDDEKPAGEEEFTNDRHGNWTRKTTYYNKLPVSIVIREILYFDDDEQNELNHPLHDMEVRKTQTKEEVNIYPSSENEDAKWLVENASPENFPFLRYYASKFNAVPSLVRYSISHIDAIGLLNQLKKHFNACEIYSYTTISQTGWKHFASYVLAFPDAEGYLFQVSNINSHSKDLFDIPVHLDDESASYVYCGQCALLRPGEATGDREEYFEEQLEHYLDKCSLNKKAEKPRINIIEVEGNNFTLTEYPVDDDFVIKDLDVNYGYGFERFHNGLMKRFSSGTKGLVLFNGEPGTGKTYYIRHLLRKMVANKKSVIYMPPNMVDHLAEPVFMTFLTNEIRSFSAAGENCVLLIEDAEPLLASRENVVRNQGITNLLNMTDGILNDLLNVQIICTFNTKMEDLDKALLRPGRLIAKKEFKALSVIDANRLAKRLGISHLFKKPATLGEIYSMRENESTLMHDTDQNERGTTTINDLIG